MVILNHWPILSPVEWMTLPVRLLVMTVQVPPGRYAVIRWFCIWDVLTTECVNACTHALVKVVLKGGFLQFKFVLVKPKTSIFICLRECRSSLMAEGLGRM